MSEKLKWMMDTAVGGKPTECLGKAIETWLEEGYPTQITTMPWAALLFSKRSDDLLPHTQTDAFKRFQAKTKVPMFPFLQGKNYGNIFRETGIAFAYTIEPKSGDANPGNTLKSLVDDVGQRVKDPDGWSKKFQVFWNKYGKELMEKMSGMRDPTLMLMIRDENLFNRLVDDPSMPKHKKENYKKLQEKLPIVRRYYERIEFCQG